MTRQLRTLAQVVEERPCTTERWLRRCISERRFAFHKVRGRILIDLRDLDQYLEGCRVEPPHPRLRSIEAMNATNAGADARRSPKTDHGPTRDLRSA